MLEKLVRKEKFNMVVVSLYPRNKGYTIGICTVDGQIHQVKKNYSFILPQGVCFVWGHVDSLYVFVIIYLIIQGDTAFLYSRWNIELH